jgi:predicted Fe-Mo cluster-binding NifX family protein
MKLSVTSTGTELDADLDPRFGRAAYFIIADPETMAFEVVENNQNLNLPQGAGIQAGKTIIDNKVDVLITGHCGPKAFKVLQRAGVKVMTGAGGTVTDAIAQFNNGELEVSAEADVEDHWV